MADTSETFQDHCYLEHLNDATLLHNSKQRFKADLMDGRRTRNVLQGGSQLTSHMRTNAEQKPLQSLGSSHHEPHAHGVRRLRARRSGRPCSTFFL